jgi:hypothetical protein
MSEISGFSTIITSERTVQDWELWINDKEISGKYTTWYDEFGDSDWDIKIHNQSELTDEEMDEITDYIKENIKK